jgi:hypothetical protein
VIVRKEEYPASEVAYLLDLPSRVVLALCDSGVLAVSRVVSNGPKQQRARRYISHCEVVRFNATRPAERRSDLLSRLSDPDAEQGVLPFTVEPTAEEAADSSVVLSKNEWRAVVAAVSALAAKVEPLKGVVEKIGPAGANVIAQGLRVRDNDGVVAA